MTYCNHMCCHSCNGSQDPFFNKTIFGRTQQGCHKSVSVLLLPFHWPADTQIFLQSNISVIISDVNILKVDSDARKLLDFDNLDLTIDELIEMHEQEQDVEQIETLDSFQSENRMTVVYVTEDLSLIKKKG
ncbi:hypothetical protein TNCV_2562521 [Trichonephila clavipes]|uniref:Uncharacterized protein n=1 Tax=Trichonephila clavipes TaxID=2585209 RepID=A0A8X6R0Y1_TRICX|nr:hypothetical protein TNCV_2562521 [Trichonephila clavipes]